MKNKIIGYLHNKYWYPKTYTDSMHISAINKLLPVYKEKAKHMKEPEWYAKGVALYFTFDEEAYVLYPSDIEASGEVFEIISDDFAEALYQIGAYDIFCSGTID